VSSIISVFGSSRCIENSEAYRSAFHLGGALAQAGFTVATGGYSGIMAAVSRGAAEHGGHVIGVVYRSKADKANQWVSEKLLVDTWQERLHTLIALGSGYAVCPGGTGTLAELAVAWEMMNKEVMPQKPLVIIGEFWRPVVKRIVTSDEGTRADRFITVVDSATAALRIFTEMFPPCST